MEKDAAKHVAAGGWGRGTHPAQERELIMILFISNEQPVNVTPQQGLADEAHI